MLLALRFDCTVSGKLSKFCCLNWARRASLSRDLGSLAVGLGGVEVALVEHLIRRVPAAINHEGVRKPRGNRLRGLRITVRISHRKAGVDLALQAGLRVENLLRDHLDVDVALQLLLRGDRIVRQPRIGCQ